MFEDSLAPPTRFDLSFRLGDIPVRVHPYFWLTTVLLGLDLHRHGIDILIYLAAWLAVVFVSILAHELGHVLMGRHYGSRGHIILTGFCGLAVGSSDVPGRRQRIAVLLAGPGAGFLLAALVTAACWIYNGSFARYLLGNLVHVPVFIDHDVEIPSQLVLFLIHNLLWINVFWGLVNLLPIWPLDGGQICRETCQAYRGRNGLQLSLQISLVTAGGFSVLALIEFIARKPLLPFLSFGNSLFGVLFFAILALTSGQLLHFLRRAGPDWEEQQEPEPRQPWEQDPDWWKRGGKPWGD
jgi:stage IV sporulation protein FB